MANNMNNRHVHPNMHGSVRGNSVVGNPNNNNATCEELMRAIMEADFFAQDLKLYLDTHPDDMRAVEMFREAVKQSRACKAAFEDSFYPLTAENAGTDGAWDWFDGVWPPFN